MIRVLFLAFLIGISIPSARAQQKERLILSTGAFGILDNEKVFMGSMELLIEDEKRLINPELGVMFTSENSIYSSFGFNIRQPLLFGFSLSFSFAPGLYYSFKKNKLGHFLEFNSGVEVNYELPDQKQISLSFHHISNGGLAKFNPGAEFILISYMVPL